MQTQNLPETDPNHPTNKVKQMLSDIVTHLHKDTTQVDEPKAQVLFEITAEVLSGLVTAYSHYEQHSEQAWK